MDDPLSLGLVAALLMLTVLDGGLVLVQAAFLDVPLGDLLSWLHPHMERLPRPQVLRSWRRRMARWTWAAHGLAVGGWLLLWMEAGRLWGRQPLVLWGIGGLALLLAVEAGLRVLIRKRPRTWAFRVFPLVARLCRQHCPEGHDRNPSALTLSWNTFLQLVQALGLGMENVQPPLLHRLYAVLRLHQTIVREIMVPRIDMVAVEVNTPPRQALDVFLQSGFSRLPVYETRIDHIVGILYSKDLLARCRKGDWDRVHLRDMVRPAFFVPEAKPVDQLLEEMQARRVHMAIVVDEYGGVAGLVTLEDIVEEIVGEIHDEYDRPQTLYRQVGDNEYVVSARLDLDDFNDLMGVNLDRNVADTLGGYLFTRLGRVPKVGDRIQEQGLTLQVEEVKGNRIVTVRVKKQASAASPA